jgi:hypothetical protein
MQPEQAKTEFLPKSKNAGYSSIAYSGSSLKKCLNE